MQRTNANKEFVSFFKEKIVSIRASIVNVDTRTPWDLPTYEPPNMVPSFAMM